MVIDKIRGTAVAVLFAAAAGIMTPLHGQTTRGGYDTGTTGDREKGGLQLSAAQTPARGPALESTISSESYYVGPSDVFAVNIWTSPPIAQQLMVTPEGTLIIPTVGEVRVADLTLAAARKLVIEAIGKRYRVGEPTFTLVIPRQIVVTVAGRVLNPGSQIMAAYNRVDKAVEEANKPVRTQTSYDQEELKSSGSTRRITIRHKDGTIARADFPKFLATKDDRWNPYLREGDIISVPPNDIAKNVVGVYGEVNMPGRIEFVEGDSVKDVLRMAYGFSPAALQDSIEFTRQDATGDIVGKATVSGRAILAGTAPDFPLQAGDRLLVRGGLDRRGDYRVKVAGEVAFPGTYPITRNTTRLTDVICSAGGFTESASLAAAEVQRQPVLSRDIAMERLQSLRGGVPPDDSSYYYLETDLRIRKEVMNTDFQALFLRGDSTQNVVLQDNDIVYVPSRKKTVYVFGQVVSPGHVSYMEGEDAAYYIRKAGGMTDRARSGDVKIVKAKSRQWLSPGDTRVEEGDYVWVPKDPERPFGYYLNVVAQSAAIVSAAVSIVLLVIQVNK